MTYRQSMKFAAIALALCIVAPSASLAYNAEPTIQSSLTETTDMASDLDSGNSLTFRDIAIIWKPVPGDWKPCVVNGKKCRCKGNVEDCRNAKPANSFKMMLKMAGRIRSQAEKRFERQRKDLTRNWAG